MGTAEKFKQKDTKAVKSHVARETPPKFTELIMASLIRLDCCILARLCRTARSVLIKRIRDHLHWWNVLKTKP